MSLSGFQTMQQSTGCHHSTVAGYCAFDTAASNHFKRGGHENINEVTIPDVVFLLQQLAHEKQRKT